MSNQTVLDELARKYVGDGQTDLVFLTRSKEGVILAVFGPSGRNTALALAQSNHLIVEDKTGMVYPTD